MSTANLSSHHNSRSGSSAATADETDATVEDSDSDSDDSDEDDDEAATLLARLQEEPRNLDLYNEVVDVLRGRGQLEELRFARKAMANEFFLSSEWYLTWLKGPSIMSFCRSVVLSVCLSVCMQRCVLCDFS